MRYILCVPLLLTLVACGWDTFDPRLVSGPVGAGGDAAGGSGGTGASGGDEGGGDGGDGGSPIGPCGTVDLLSETFDAPRNRQIWDDYTSGDGTFATGTGALTLTIDNTTYSTAELTSDHLHDLRGSSVAVEVTSVPITAPAEGLFWLGPDSSNHARFMVRGGQLRAAYVLSGSELLLSTSAYDATAHRWWRIREDAGVLFWEVSPDGSAYTTVAERPVTGLFSVNAVRARLRNYAANTAPAAPEIFTVETILTEGPGNMAWCPVSAIHDDFDDGYRSNDWVLSGGTSGANALEVDGKVVVNLIPARVNDYQYISAANYDFTSGQLTAELVQHGGAATSSFLELTRTGQKIIFQVIDVDDMNGGTVTEIQALTDVDGDVQLRGSRVYDPAVHRFWRIRHDGVGLLWDTSADGLTWPDAASDERQIATASPTPADLIITDLDVRVGARAEAEALSPGQPQFDNLNLLP